MKPGFPDPFVIVDAAMNDPELPRPALYDARSRDRPGPPDRRSDDRQRRRPGLARAATPSPPAATWGGWQRIDLIVFRTAGAYAATMASTYNSPAADRRG